MDIEGAEVEALRGMTHTLSKTTSIAMEGVHIYDGKESHHTVIPILEESRFPVKRDGGMVYALKQ